MSWSFEFTGNTDAVKAKVVATCDRLAKSYNGQQEAKDIAAVRDRAVELIDNGAFTADWNGVSVKANGSHYVEGGKVANASLQLSVSRVQLVL